jgi:hypothetical protein
MKKILISLILIIPVLLVMAATRAMCLVEAPPVLASAKQHVAQEFDRLDTALKQAAEMLGATGLTGDKARPALTKLCNNFDYAVDCATVDLQGKMITIEPAPYRQFEGKDISAQEQVKRVIKSGRPVMSSVFRSVEGFPAVDVEYPVVTPAGQRLGQVSILFQPEKLMREIIVPLTQGTPVDIWAMEKSGLILYDADAPEIGLNLFTSSLYQPYKSLVNLGRRIAAKPEGNGIYKFRSHLSPAIVQKNAFWETISLYGTEWRLVSIHVEKQNPTSVTGGLIPSETLEKKLENFAVSKSLKKALSASAGDSKQSRRLFQKFYEEAPGIYSVQWMDEKGINRFGYPAENSLQDYNYHDGRTLTDQHFLKILDKRKSAVYEKPLLEGKTGIFTFRPVFQQDRYLGMVYYIRLKQ